MITIATIDAQERPFQDFIQDFELGGGGGGGGGAGGNRMVAG